MSDRLNRILLLIILLLALALRLYRLDGQSLWADEGNSAALAGRPLAQIARDAAHDIHPPLYYWLLHGWTRLFGTSEVGLRSLSVVLGLLLVWLTYLIGRRLHGLATGLLAAFLAAVNPFQVYYSQEARMYMLLAVCGAALFYTFVGLLGEEREAIEEEEGKEGKKGKKGKGAASLVSILSLIPLSTLGLYTHYSFPILLLAVNLLYLAWWVASCRQGRSWMRLARWAALQGAASLLFLPWLPIALKQATGWPGVAAPFAWKEALLATFRLLALGPACATKISGWWLIPFGVLPVWGLWPWKGKSNQQISKSMGPPSWFVWLVPVVWLVLPVLMMLALGLFKEAYLKFLLIASLPFCLLSARGMASAIVGLPTRAKNPLLSLFVFCVLLLLIPTGQALHGYYFDPTCARDDYRGVAQYVTAVARPDDAVLLNAPGQIEVWSYYDRSGLAIYPLPRQRPPDPAATIAELEAIAARHRTLYALLWATDESDPQRIVETWLDQHAFKATDVWQGNVRFVTYAFSHSVVEPAFAVAPQEPFGQYIWLREVAVLNDYVAPGDVVQVSLVWEAGQSVERRYKITLQLLDERNQVMAQRDAEPVGESRPTDGWRAGERIHDAHGLLIPLGTPPGSYRLIVGLYDRENGQRLRLADDSDHFTVGQITVERPTAPPPAAVLPIRYRRAFDFGEITLLGHDRYKRGYGHAPDTPLYPGDLLHVTFFWRADETVAQDWTFTLALYGQPVSLNAPLVSEAYPTSRWQAGEVVRGEHDLLLPPDLRPGRYRLVLTPAPGGRPEGTVTLGTIEVKKMAEEVKLRQIELVPFGEVGKELLNRLCMALQGAFGRPCRVVAGLPLPTWAYHPARRQFRADGFLQALRRLDAPDAERLLGVVDADCYAPGLNFVFGQASVGGREAVIALPRLRQSFYGLPEDEALFQERAVKEAVHELGHTYGLGHCPDPRCVMHFSNSLQDTDIKAATFCRACQEAISARLRQGHQP
ncbi:MAG: archaemetzincin family Zn-dependent metalloprotease [Anaerolineae bacterium]|nr:archaemetzincin family Zn-dependent metalloprotease [Anaerolineae bacterium]